MAASGPQLERPLRAVPILEQAIRAYANESPQERPLCELCFPKRCSRGTKVDQAAATASAAAEKSIRAGSDRATQGMARLRRLLLPHAGQPSVDRFLELTN